VTKKFDELPFYCSAGNRCHRYSFKLGNAAAIHLRPVYGAQGLLESASPLIDGAKARIITPWYIQSEDLAEMQLTLKLLQCLLIDKTPTKEEYLTLKYESRAHTLKFHDQVK